MSLKNAALLFAALTCFAPAIHAAPPQAAPLVPAQISVGSEPEKLPRNWLAFTYDSGAVGCFRSLDDNLTDGQKLIIVLRDGTVIWNDTVFNYGAYYPEAVSDTPRRLVVSPDAWRQGKADPAKLAAFIALLKKQGFFTEKAEEDGECVCPSTTQHVGVKMDGRVRVVDRVSLSVFGGDEKNEYVSNYTRHLYKVYQAIVDLRPAVSTRYVPHTIRVSVWKVEPRGKIIPDAENEAEKPEKPIFADWPQSGVAGLPNPARMSEPLKEVSTLGISQDDDLRDPSTYTYLTGSKAQALMDLVAQNGTFRYKNVLYRIKWSPSLRAPEPTPELPKRP